MTRLADPIAPPTEQALCELLPWYVNGSLSPEEHLRVTEHLPQCSDCQAHYPALRTLSYSLEQQEQQQRDECTATGPSQALWHRIDAYEEGRREQQPASIWHDAWEQLTRPWLGTGLAALLVVVIGIGWDPSMTPTTPQSIGGYQTLSSSAETPVIHNQQARFRLLFHRDTTDAEIHRLLTQIDGQIVAGPSQRGVYTVDIQAQVSNNALDTIGQQLQQHPQVLVAEQISP